MLDPDCLQRRIMDWEKSKELDKGMMIQYEYSVIQQGQTDLQIQILFIKYLKTKYQKSFD